MDWINVGKARARTLRSRSEEPLEAGERVVTNYSTMTNGSIEVSVLIVRTPALYWTDHINNDLSVRTTLATGDV